MPRPALFLDRDGTLIADVGYPKDPEQVALVDGAADVLRELQVHYSLVVVSNQSGIGRGMIDEREAAAVHARFVAEFARRGVHFSGCYYCPHMPGAGCECRKPAPGMLLEAAEELLLDLSRSIMIGDKASDLEAGRAAGCAHVVRLGPDVDSAAASVRCDDWHAVRAFVASLE